MSAVIEANRQRNPSAVPYLLEDSQAPHITTYGPKFNAHFLKDKQGSLDIWIDILCPALLPSIKNQDSLAHPAPGPGRSVFRAWKQSLYLHQCMTGSNTEVIDTVRDVFHDVRDLLFKQVRHNLHHIRQRAASELIERTLCEILAIHLGKPIGVGNQLKDFWVDREGVSLNVGSIRPYHLPLAELATDARFQFDMRFAGDSCPPAWFPMSVHPSGNSPSTQSPSFYCFKENISVVITKDVIEEDLRQVLYGLQQGFHPCMLTPGADKWKYSLGLYELFRGYRSLEYDPRLFQIAYELVKEDLHDKVQRDLLLFAKWRLGDPIQHPHLVLSILTLCLSTKIEVQLPEGLIIAGTLESVSRCGDDMVALVVQCCDDRVLVITERIERAPFLWTGDRTVTTVSLPVELCGLPPYWFAVLIDVPRWPVQSTR